MRVTYVFLRLMGKSYSFPFLAYSFMGIEIIAVAAYEARDANHLKWPSRTIPLVIFILYFLCTIGEALTVPWTNNDLPAIYNGINGKSTQSPTNPHSTSVVIIAVWSSGRKILAGFINGTLIFSGLSAANTSLYASSRTLFGLTRELRESKSPLLQRLKGLSKLDYHVPIVAVFVSFLSFLWLPWLQLAKQYPVVEVIIEFWASGTFL
jgi:amino acid transporter